MCEDALLGPLPTPVSPGEEGEARPTKFAQKQTLLREAVWRLAAPLSASDCTAALLRIFFQWVLRTPRLLGTLASQ